MRYDQSQDITVAYISPEGRIVLRGARVRSRYGTPHPGDLSAVYDTYGPTARIIAVHYGSGEHGLVTNQDDINVIE